MLTRALLAGLLALNIFAAPSPAQETPLAEVIQRLSSGDAAARLQAIVQIEERADEAKSAVPALAKALSDDEAKVRYHAARALGAIGPHAAAAVPTLIAALKDADALVRAHSIRSLGLIGEPSKRHAKEIGALITDRDEKVRREVAHAMLRIRPDRSVTIPLFTKILEDGDPAVRNMVLQAVAELGADGVPFLMEAMERPESRYWACLALGQVGPPAAKAVPKLLAVAQDKEPEHRLEALMALGAIKPTDAKTIAAIAERLENDTYAGARFAAAFALGSIGPPAKPASEQLMKQMSSSDAFLKVTSAWALSKIYSGDEAILAKTLPVIVRGSTSGDPNVRSSVARSLGDLKVKPGISLPTLIALLGDAAKPVVAQAVEGTSAFGAEAVPLTSKALAESSQRLGAVFVLKRLGPAAKEAVPDLVQAMSREGDLDVRREIFFALAAIGPGSEEAMPELIKALTHENVKVRNGASYALGKIGPAAKSALPALKRNMQSKQDEYLALISAWAAAQIDFENAETVRQTMPAFIKGLEHPEMLIRLEAANTLALFGSRAKEAVPALKKAVADKDANVSAAAAAALQKIGE